jgi:enterochelin esterase-like enzyme
LKARGPDFTAELERVFGSNPSGEKHDLLLLGKSAKDRGVLPALHLDCGVDDYLIEHNRHLAATLTEEEISHVYLEKPGAHDWAYWDQNIASALLRIGPSRVNLTRDKM